MGGNAAAATISNYNISDFCISNKNDDYNKLEIKSSDRSNSNRVGRSGKQQSSASSSVEIVKNQSAEAEAAIVTVAMKVSGGVGYYNQWQEGKSGEDQKN